MQSVVPEKASDFTRAMRLISKRPDSNSLGRESASMEAKIVYRLAYTVSPQLKNL